MEPMQATSWCQIQTTVETVEQAESLAHWLVSENWAPCVQIIPMQQSVYHWKGRIESAREILLLIKTRCSLWDRLESALSEEHPYDCPQLVMLPLVNVGSAYERWLEEQLRVPD